MLYLHCIIALYFGLYFRKSAIQLYFIVLLVVFHCIDQLSVRAKFVNKFVNTAQNRAVLITIQLCIDNTVDVFPRDLPITENSSCIDAIQYCDTALYLRT